MNETGFSASSSSSSSFYLPVDQKTQESKFCENFFCDLLPEIRVEILSLLDGEQLACCSRVSKKFLSWTQENAIKPKIVLAEIFALAMRTINYKLIEIIGLPKIETLPIQIAMLLTRTATLQAANGNIEGAEKNFLKAQAADENQKQMNSLLVEKIKVQAANGNIKSAKEVINGLKGVYWKDRALFEIAKYQAAVGDIEGSKETINQIQQIGKKVDALILIARNQVSKGHRKGAKQTSEETMIVGRDVQDSSNRNYLLRHTAKLQASIDNVDTAKKTANAIDDTCGESLH